MLPTTETAGNAAVQMPPGTRFAGLTLPEVPSWYLAGCLTGRGLRLSAGLRQMVAAELGRRGEQVPSQPPPMPRRCRRCGPGAGVAYRWLVDS